MRRRWRVVLTAAAAGLVGAWWLGASSGAAAPVAQAAAMAAPASAATAPAPQAHGRAPYSDAGRAQRQQALALWRRRLERAQGTLAAYEGSTRYPYGSRPATEHRDRWQAHPLIRDDMPLLQPGGAPTPGVRVHTSQQAVFASANDSVLLTVSAVDDAGHVLPLRVLGASAHPPLDLSAQAKPVTAPTVAQAFADDGTHGDATAGDGTWTTRLSPAAEGFGDYGGVIRTELTIQVGDAQGYVAFDVVYSPEVPAAWSGAVRESLVDGSLDFVLPVQVAHAGRYVVTGRVDDANGQPFAFLNFNQELGTGAQQVTLPVFGRLVRDAKPAFPLVLHDVEGFLLEPDTFPDRALMAPLDGPIHTTRNYPLAAFSDAAWTSEEKSRYLAEYGRDVAQAQGQVDQLSAGDGP